MTEFCITVLSLIDKAKLSGPAESLPEIWAQPCDWWMVLAAVLPELKKHSPSADSHRKEQFLAVDTAFLMS